MVRNLAIALSLSFAAAAQQPAGAPATQTAPAPAAAAQPAPAVEKPAAAPAAAKAPVDQAISADGKMHIDAAVAFLKAWGKGRWDEARPVAADKVAVKMGDKSYDVDVAGGKSEVKAVLPFAGAAGAGRRLVARSDSSAAMRRASSSEHDPTGSRFAFQNEFRSQARRRRPCSTCYPSSPRRTRTISSNPSSARGGSRRRAAV